METVWTNINCFTSEMSQIMESLKKSKQVCKRQIPADHEQTKLPTPNKTLFLLGLRITTSLWEGSKTDRTSYSN